mmetsp:Transcript_27602/g.78058  ORF Transcript_27602/g.78058 Transcript_27602/m.78058 type:complete len:662 (-) Transcript_27602:271-2256(-)|eukprot:CAMPEP_0117653030 /NCGR_PEP_ID=MMETSP0804-20121206/2968_1 /TAXON_ID=1074897 /ORGANISM="Tetraselmis astigmatica, Strain CCMP880" /LENGTH=661 /DNA_ID=CAMNT_0005459167 /DNA_START=682 /DNA_END=2667 /DNA_ORIENTATION=+
MLEGVAQVVAAEAECDFLPLHGSGAFPGLCGVAALLVMEDAVGAKEEAIKGRRNTARAMSAIREELTGRLEVAAVETPFGQCLAVLAGPAAPELVARLGAARGDPFRREPQQQTTGVFQAVATSLKARIHQGCQQLDGLQSEAAKTERLLQDSWSLQQQLCQAVTCGAPATGTVRQAAGQTSSLAAPNEGKVAEDQGLCGGAAQRGVAVKCLSLDSTIEGCRGVVVIRAEVRVEVVPSQLDSAPSRTLPSSCCWLGRPSLLLSWDRTSSGGENAPLHAEVRCCLHRPARDANDTASEEQWWQQQPHRLSGVSSKERAGSASAVNLAFTATLPLTQLLNRQQLQYQGKARCGTISEESTDLHASTGNCHVVFSCDLLSHTSEPDSPAGQGPSAKLTSSTPSEMAIVAGSWFPSRMQEAVLIGRAPAPQRWPFAKQEAADVVPTRILETLGVIDLVGDSAGRRPAHEPPKAARFSQRLIILRGAGMPLELEELAGALHQQTVMVPGVQVVVANSEPSSDAALDEAHLRSRVILRGSGTENGSCIEAELQASSAPELSLMRRGLEVAVARKSASVAPDLTGEGTLQALTEATEALAAELEAAKALLLQKLDLCQQQARPGAPATAQNTSPDTGGPGQRSTAVSLLRLQALTDACVAAVASEEGL